MLPKFAADIRVDKLRPRPRWEGPFAATTRTPKTSRSQLAPPTTLPARMQCRPSANAGRLKPLLERVDARLAPGPVSDPGREGEHGAELLRCLAAGP
jgi:hypothetical protein